MLLDNLYNVIMNNLFKGCKVFMVNYDYKITCKKQTIMLFAFRYNPNIEKILILLFRSFCFSIQKFEIPTINEKFAAV